MAFVVSIILVSDDGVMEGRGRGWCHEGDGWEGGGSGERWSWWW